MRAAVGGGGGEGSIRSHTVGRGPWVRCTAVRHNREGMAGPGMVGADGSGSSDWLLRAEAHGMQLARKGKPIYRVRNGAVGCDRRSYRCRDDADEGLC